MFLNLDYLAPGSELVNTLRAHIGPDEDKESAASVGPETSQDNLASTGTRGSASTLPDASDVDSVSWRSDDTPTNGQYILIKPTRKKKIRIPKVVGGCGPVTGNLALERYDALSAFRHRRGIMKNIRVKRKSMERPTWVYGPIFFTDPSTGSTTKTLQPLLGPLAFSIPPRSVHGMLESDEDDYGDLPAYERSVSRVQSPIVGGDESDGKLQADGSGLFPLVWRLFGSSNGNPALEGEQAHHKSSDGVTLLQTPGEQFLGDVDSLSGHREPNEPTDKGDASDSDVVQRSAGSMPTYESRFRRERKNARNLNLSKYIMDIDDRVEDRDRDFNGLSPNYQSTRVHDALDSLDWCNKQVQRKKLRKLLRKIISRSNTKVTTVIPTSSDSWNDMYVSSYSSEDRGQRQRQRRSIVGNNDIYCSLESLSSKSKRRKSVKNEDDYAGLPLSPTSLAQVIKPTPETSVGREKKSKLASALQALGLQMDPLAKASREQVQQAIVDEAVKPKLAENLKPFNSNESKPLVNDAASWLNTAVHTTLWLGSFGIVSRNVPGKSLTLRDDDTSDHEADRMNASKKRLLK
jgi:hypothetical protein